MFKISFKENNQFPVKKVQRFNDDRVTVVTLKGVAQLPVFLQYFIPHKIFDWTDTLKNVDVEFTMRRMFITVTGKSICSKEDKVDRVLGERIAEARAKIALYKFMKNLCKQVYIYYRNLLYAHSVIKIEIDKENKDNLCQSILKYRKLVDKEKQHLKDLLYGGINTESTSQP